MTHGKGEAGGAGGGNRTHTALRPPDFESGASASSATPAALGSLSRRVGRAEGRLYKIARTSRKILPQRRGGRRESPRRAGLAGATKPARCGFLLLRRIWRTRRWRGRRGPGR